MGRDGDDHAGIAAALRTEACALLDQTGMRGLLAKRFDDCAVAGSFALDLMTWRDLDIYVPAERDQRRRFVETLPPVDRAFAASGRTIFRAVFNDEWAKPRGDYGSGYYWGLRAAGRGPEWKIDLWGWAPETYARKLGELEALGHGLAAADRSLILALKHQAQRQPGFRDTLTSYDVYRFVIDGAGTTLAELTAFCAARRAAKEGPAGRLEKR